VARGCCSQKRDRSTIRAIEEDAAKVTGKGTVTGKKAIAGGAKKVGVGITDAVTRDKNRRQQEQEVTTMRSAIVLTVLGCAAVVSAQGPASSFPRGSSQQSWQNPGLKSVLAKCKTPPKPFAIPVAQNRKPGPPPEPAAAAASTSIPGVIAGGQTWKVVWQWEGNNADGIIAGDKGTMLFANNDASNVMRLDPATATATVIHKGTNTGGALSRSKNGALFLAARGLNGGIMQLEPQRKMLTSTFNDEPIECVGGVLNDLVADSRGGVYLAITGAGVFYADAKGVTSKYGEVPLANGIVLSADEKTLYVTNGGVVLAFDVTADGSLANQREFGKLRGGQGGDGSAIDAEGRLYVATGSSVDVFSPKGEFLGSIP
jgi:sugar lactone lactonase YvrE